MNMFLKISLERYIKNPYTNIYKENLNYKWPINEKLRIKMVKWKAAPINWSFCDLILKQRMFHSLSFI